MYLGEWPVKGLHGRAAGERGEDGPPVQDPGGGSSHRGQDPGVQVCTDREKIWKKS